MIDTMTVLAYLLGDDYGHNKQIKLNAEFSQTQVAKVSPKVIWKNVPPEADSLVLIVKDSNIPKKENYYWVVYNIPADSHGVNLGESQVINKNNVGLNSWGQKNYHALNYPKKNHKIYITVYALDKKFSSIKNMTGESLEQKIKGHVLAKGAAVKS